MKRTGKVDILLAAQEMQDFFGGLGFRRVLVYGGKSGFDIALLSGRILPLTRKERQQFNSMKYWGMCYRVTRMVRLFGKNVEIWNNKNWDVD